MVKEALDRLNLLVFYSLFLTLLSMLATRKEAMIRHGFFVGYCYRTISKNSNHRTDIERAATCAPSSQTNRSEVYAYGLFLLLNLKPTRVIGGFGQFG